MHVDLSHRETLQKIHGVLTGANFSVYSIPLVFFYFMSFSTYFLFLGLVSISFSPFVNFLSCMYCFLSFLSLHILSCAASSAV
jgi:hypothetical protein